MRNAPLLLLVIMLFCTSASKPPSLAAVKAKAQAAGYTGDLRELAEAAREARLLAPDPEQAALAHYWAGYALWQRALNGVNVKADAAQIAADRDAALAEMDAAIAARESFADAHAVAAWLHGWLYMANAGDKEAHSKAILAHVKRARELEPENPRVLWEYAYVLQRSDREKSLRILEELAQRQDVRVASAEPDWGVPEAAMTLSYIYANAKPPDLARAEQLANRALQLRPQWSYVKSILIPMITAARAAARNPPG